MATKRKWKATIEIIDDGIDDSENINFLTKEQLVEELEHHFGDFCAGITVDLVELNQVGDFNYV